MKLTRYEAESIVYWERLAGRIPDLSGANLRKANLSEADLRKANLSEADLREADLREADLRWADLSGTNLRFAYGSALVGGNRIISVQDKYRVILVDDMLFIGCLAHRVHEWFAFSDGDIDEMDSGALTWWRDYGWKKKLFHLIDAADFGIELGD